jgi:protocatechuate 3,4-dioxygenase beta subunit
MKFDQSAAKQCARAATAALFLMSMLISTVTHAVTYASAPVPFAWVDPSTHTVISAASTPIAFRTLPGCATNVPNTDDTISDPVPLGFNFQFAGVVVDSVRVVSNGRLQFINQNPLNGPVFDTTACGFGSPDQFPLPNANIPYTMKVYGADIDPTNSEEAPSYVTRCSLTGTGAPPFGNLPCYVSFATTGTLPNQTFVVTWNNVPEFTVGNSPQGNYQLQALVRQDGTFTYQYGQNTSVPGAQIGWEAAANTGDYDIPSISPLPPQNFAIEFYIAGPVNVAATSGTPQSAVVGTAFANPLQVTVTDLVGNPVSGVTVTFAAPVVGASASVPASAVTDGSGVASVTATANATPGNYSVTASVAGVATPAAFDLTNTAGAPANIVATGGTPQSAAISTAFADPLQVTVTDMDGNPVIGVTVNFAAPGSGASASLPSTAVTDGSGVASVTATANTIAGSYSVTASVVGVVTPASFSLTNTAGPPANIAATSGTPQSAMINTPFANSLQVTVTDVGGNPVAGATVNFAAPGGGASAAVPATAITDGTGVASVTAVANSIAGSYGVAASVVGAGAPAIFSLTNTAGPAAAVSATGGTPQSTAINTAFTNPLQVTVTDVGGNPVAGVTVNFVAPGSGASATVAASAVTNPSGIASVTATANATAGSYSVSASVVGVATPATFSLTNTAGTATTVAATGGTPQSTVINTAFASPLQVTVTDAGSNPVAGVMVTFAAPVSGASATVPASASTNASGVASVSATANGITGGYSVTATVAGVVTPATFSLTNTSPVPTKLVITSVNGGVNPTVATAFSVVVQAQDATNTPENVLASTAVTLSLNTGTGTLGGTLTCSIAAGSSTCTVVGVTYSKVETGVVITATRTSGDALDPANSTPFDVVGLTPGFGSAVSRKVHGAAGTFDLPLSAVTTNPTTEPRIGPVQTIVFTFDKPITSATATITEGTAVAGTPTFSGNDVIVGLTGVTDQHYVTIVLADVASADGGTGGSASVRVGFLLGDVNQNRVVTVADLGLVNAQLAQLVTAANFLKDVNASGTLSVADKGLTQANLTRSLPAP